MRTPDPASHSRRLASPATMLREPQASQLKLHSFFTSALYGGVKSASRHGRWAPGNEPPVPTEEEARWTSKSGWTFWRRQNYISLAHVQRVLGIKRTGSEATTHFHVMSVDAPPLADVPSWLVALLKKRKCYCINNCHNSGHCEMPY